MERIHEGVNKFYIGAYEEDPVAFVRYYNKGDEMLVIEHVYVSRELRDQGIGKLLVRKMVEFAREKGYRLSSVCSYADETLSANKDYADVYEGWY